jgi:hypothetical protein
MKLNFCTLFDHHYLSRGLALYQSLLQQGVEFHLYIFAFDEKSDELLRKMKLPEITVVSLKEFEDPQLLAAKANRTRTEYCWTCTSSIILYCLKNFNIENCTYLDADLYFYQSPQLLIDEKPADAHVIITSHRYTSYYDKSRLSGKYCVQFMYFDHSEKAMTVLNWWRERCLEWCYNRMEDGKFGDQKYLDDWTSRFEGVWELQHLGGGLAPWNIQQYRFASISEGMEISTGEIFSPVFYHFHGVKFYSHGKVIYAPSTYHLNATVQSVFYEPYVKKISEAKALIQKSGASFDPNGVQPASSYFSDKFFRGRLTSIINNWFRG